MRQELNLWDAEFWEQLDNVVTVSGPGYQIVITLPKKSMGVLLNYTKEETRSKEFEVTEVVKATSARCQHGIWNDVGDCQYCKGI